MNKNMAKDSMPLNLSDSDIDSIDDLNIEESKKSENKKQDPNVVTIEPKRKEITAKLSEDQKFE